MKEGGKGRVATEEGGGRWRELAEEGCVGVGAVARVIFTS